MLYERLIHLFANLGTNDAYGNGQYYITEDNNGGSEQLIKIFELSLVNPYLVAEIQREVADLEMDWEVKLMLEMFDPEYTGKGESLSIFKNRIAEHWDKQRIKKEMSHAFLWTD